MSYAMLFAFALWALSGCSQQPSPPASKNVPPPRAGASPADTLPPPPKYVAATAQNAPAQNVAGEVNVFLTEQLRIFLRDKRRLPESFAELARTRLDSVPRPPEGRKWVIDSATTQVKAVAAQ
jgi:hypothetical protein